MSGLLRSIIARNPMRIVICQNDMLLSINTYLEQSQKRKSEREPAMTTVYLIRHAEAEGNLYRRAQGHKNATVTDRGYQQIAALTRRFAGERIDAVYSSDLCRTCTTAKSVTLAHHLPLHKTQDLREICVGEWEDRTWAELAYFDRDRLLLFNTDLEKWHVSGGQDVDTVRDRMLRTLRGIIAAHPGRTVAVFSHGMALRTLVGTLQGLSLYEINATGHAENTAVTKLECIDADHIRVVYRDDASHLPEALRTLGRQAWTKNKGGVEAGIYFAPSGADGHFDVLCEGEVIGAVSVGRCENGIAEIEEYWLEKEAQGRGFGIQLIGQALSCARRHGCDILRCTVPKSNAHGVKRAKEWGFFPVSETAEETVFEKYFGYSEEYQIRKLQDAIKNN